MKINIQDYNINLDPKLKEQLEIQLQYVSHILPKEGELKIIISKVSDELFTLDARYYSRLLEFQFKEASSSLTRLIARAPIALVHQYQSEHRSSARTVFGIA